MVYGEDLGFTSDPRPPGRCSGQETLKPTLLPIQGPKKARVLAANLALVFGAHLESAQSSSTFAGCFSSIAVGFDEVHTLQCLRTLRFDTLARWPRARKHFGSQQRRCVAVKTPCQGSRHKRKDISALNMR